MKAIHPDSASLRAYALGDLPLGLSGQLEGHLRRCETCQETVRALREEFTQLVEELPPLEAQPASWQHIQARLRPTSSRAWPWLAAATLLVLVSLGWGLQQRAASAALMRQQQVVAGWLARGDLQVLELYGSGHRPAGRVLLAADHTALFVLPPPPPGETYHAWVGLNNHWKYGDPMRLAASSQSGVFTVSASGTNYLCYSLEKAAVPPKPSRVLGWAFL